MCNADVRHADVGEGVGTDHPTKEHLPYAHVYMYTFCACMCMHICVHVCVHVDVCV